MTTFEPGASDVFTHGLAVSPRSTAFRASRPAATITDGFDVFVHDVIAAITTAPWSSSAPAVAQRERRRSSDTRSATCSRRSRAGRGLGLRVVAPSRRSWPADRTPGRTPRICSSASVCGAGQHVLERHAGTTALASVSETRSCGRFGPGERRARPRRGRAPSSRSRSAPRCRRRATGPAPWCTSRRARRARPRGR